MVSQKQYPTFSALDQNPGVRYARHSMLPCSELLDLFTLRTSSPSVV